MFNHVFKDNDDKSTIIDKNIVNYTHNLTTASLGIQSTKIISGSSNNNYWNSLNVLFYTSGSPVYSNGKELKFTSPSSNLINTGKQYSSKFHGYSSSSIIQIPQQYYGEKIKPGSFQFRDLNNSDNNGSNPIIKDDGFGNLYSTNAHHSQSRSSSLSEDNYVGNIFYDKGLAVITETGSWSGSVDYSDLATNYTLNFSSFNTIYSHEYSVTLLPQDFNFTTNYGIRNTLDTSHIQGNKVTEFSLATRWIASPFTGSAFQPYITTINLYKDGEYDEPVIQATLPKPIRKSDKINIRFKIKLDL